MKNNIISFFIGAIIFSFITFVSAERIYNAKDIEYHNELTEVTNVGDALSEIYSTGNIEAKDLRIGMEALSQGKKIIGNQTFSISNKASKEAVLTGTNTITLSLEKGDYLIDITCASGEYGASGGIDGCDSLTNIGYYSTWHEGTDISRRRGSITNNYFFCRINEATNIVTKCIPFTTYNAHLNMQSVAIKY